MRACIPVPLLGQRACTGDESRRRAGHDGPCGNSFGPSWIPSVHDTPARRAPVCTRARHAPVHNTRGAPVLPDTWGTPHCAWGSPGASTVHCPQGLEGLKGLDRSSG